MSQCTNKRIQGDVPRPILETATIAVLLATWEIRDSVIAWWPKVI